MIYVLCMARTTIDIDGVVLAELKKRRESEGRPIGAIASELLAVALADSADRTGVEAPELEWIAQPMDARVDIEDKEAVRLALGE